MTARVCVIGSGLRFMSGMSVFTLRLANVLAEQYDVSVITMRQLLPTFLYPGKERVGCALTEMTYAPGVRVMDGVDWYWLPSIFRALAFVLRERPEVMIFQWWSGTVLHSYLALALLGRLLGARVIIEFHEVLDTAEAKIPLAKAYVDLLVPWFKRLAQGVVVHSSHDRDIIAGDYPGDPAVAVMSLGTFDQFCSAPSEDHPAQVVRECPPDCCNLLFFGVIRPFKGLEDLIAAFDAIPEDEIEGYWLTVVGETWEGWTLPAERIATSRYSGRVTFVNRYVHDSEVPGFFAGADVVVLPYHRSSASGPLHVAMSWGLPVVTTAVGGLTDAVAEYEGAVLAPPRDPTALLGAIRRAAAMRGQRFKDPHSWEHTAERYDDLIASVMGHSLQRRRTA